MIVEVIGTIFVFTIKIYKHKKHKNIYKRISDFLKHKTLNKQLSLRCFDEHKKHKTLFISTKSYAQDVVCEHKMMHIDVVYEHR